MTMSKSPLDAVEAALLELAEADKARVFAPTPIDRHLLAATPVFAPVSAGSVIRRFRAPLAAAAVLAIGVWSLMFYSELSSLRQASRLVDHSLIAMSGETTPERTANGDFMECFSGPQPAQLVSCHSYDFDADGDVDLADYRSYQLGLDNTPHIH